MATTIKDIPIEKGEAVWIVDKETNKVTPVIIVPEKGGKTKQEKVRDHMYLVFLGFGIASFALGFWANYKKVNGN